MLAVEFKVVVLQAFNVSSIVTSIMLLVGMLLLSLNVRFKQSVESLTYESSRCCSALVV